MFIQTESTPNDDSLKFIPGVTVMGDGTAEFLDTRSSLASPLAIRLMGIEGVKGVFYGPDFVTVSKDSENPWAVIKPEVYSILMEFFSSGQKLFRSEEEREAAGPQDTRILDTDSETVAMIKELLETRVRPAIMEDGGDIEYRGFEEDGFVKVKLKGSCRGCDSSTVTLKSGIERMLMHYIPEVKGVEQVRILTCVLGEYNANGYSRSWTKKKRLLWMSLRSWSNDSHRNSLRRNLRKPLLDLATLLLIFSETEAWLNICLYN
jgi:NFU1 iron-sulfur cluster scaffold homolog, mitochondrial